VNFIGASLLFAAGRRVISRISSIRVHRARRAVRPAPSPALRSLIRRGRDGGRSARQRPDARSRAAGSDANLEDGLLGHAAAALANLPSFANIGLTDSNFGAKPALAAWDALFAPALTR